MYNITHTEFLLNPTEPTTTLKDQNKKISQVSLRDSVGVTGFEPATPWSQTRCATNCATPRITVTARLQCPKTYLLHAPRPSTAARCLKLSG